VSNENTIDIENGENDENDENDEGFAGQLPTELSPQSVGLE
jgi:hypothetical protein